MFVCFFLRPLYADVSRPPKLAGSSTCSTHRSRPPATGAKTKLELSCKIRCGRILGPVTRGDTSMEFNVMERPTASPAHTTRLRKLRTFPTSPSMVIALKSLLIYACSQYDSGQPYLVSLGTRYHHIDEADFKENKQVTQSARDES
ncbi:hypothetical protein SCLCIDRAFT_26037 [Scleroderma citrinum Foug A]|uniref:Uncharacterized protein n=1 Tax=Scleroderma citrinum Foug A TaxID=1036808 RepID=A0A0C2ZHY9_9AGAM|nr:hypothetical protein SCLCIDRAFT_26037 [Scleroderma citrinum Foug A]